MLVADVTQRVDDALVEGDTGDCDPAIARRRVDRHRHRARTLGRLGVGELRQPGQLFPRRYDLGGMPPRRIGRPDTGDRGGSGVPEAHAAVVVQQNDAVPDVGQREGSLGAALGLAIEPCVLDRDRGAGREFLGEIELGVLELPGLRDEGEGAVGAFA
jgi:hypothetical protein